MALLKSAAIELHSGHLLIKKDIDKLEEVQRRGTKITRRLKGLVWKMRLKELNMDNLVQRQPCGDTAVIYKCTGDENIKEGEELRSVTQRVTVRRNGIT